MNPLPSPTLDPAEHRSCLETTGWSLVTSAGGQSADSTHALEALCRTYWFPVYAFVRCRGFSRDEAVELTRGFFAELLHTDTIGRADPERGRFRTFLLAAASRYLTDIGRRSHATRRAGTEAALPLDPGEADAWFERESVDPGLTPEEAFDHHWAMNTIGRAIAELQAEYAASHRGQLVDALGPFVWGGAVPQPPVEAAAALGLTEHAFTAAVHRLRHRLRDHLRTLVAATVDDAGQTEGELRHLLGVVRRRPLGA